MNKFKIFIIIVISILLSPNFAHTQLSGDIWYEYMLDITMDRLKEEVDFANWPCKDGPVRAGIILTKEHFSSFQEEEDHHNIFLKDEIEYILAIKHTYRWSVEGKGKVDIRVMIMQTCLQAQNYLIRRYAVNSMPPDSIHLPPRGVEYNIIAGDVSFVRGMDLTRDTTTDIRFVRNNIYAEITAYDEMRPEIKQIAEDLDSALLSRPTGEDAEKLIPKIKRFQASQGTTKVNEKNLLVFEIESPTGEQVVLTPAAGVAIVDGAGFTDDQVVFKWKSTGGGIRREQSGDYYYTPETEGLHTITLLVADKVAGLILEANININVSDGAKKTSGNTQQYLQNYFMPFNFLFSPGIEFNGWAYDPHLFDSLFCFWLPDNYFNYNNYQNIFDYPNPFAGNSYLDIFVNQNAVYEEACFKNYPDYYVIDPFAYRGQNTLFAETHTASLNQYFDFSNFNNIYNNLYHFEPSRDYLGWFNDNCQTFLFPTSSPTYSYLDFIFNQ